MTDRTLGAVLRGHRERAGLTQSQLAGKAGLSLRALRDLEQDRVSKPRARSLAALATALGLTGPQLRDLESAPAGPPRPGPASVAVLGPLEVRRGGRIRELPAALPRRLLVLLALHHDRGVSHAEIVQVLWGGQPPPSVRNLVHTYVGGLRRLLEPSRSAGSYRILVRSGDGYRIDPGQCRIDVADFGELAESGLAARAAGTRERAEVLLGQALSLWRGLAADDDPVLAGHPATVRLNERRMRVALAYADTAAR